MQPLTLKQLATEIVRAAERFPDRVGDIRWGEPGNPQCLMGVVGDTMYKAGYRSMNVCQCLSCLIDSNLAFPQGAAYNLGSKAVKLNDSGMPWGQIVKALGLVPGEVNEEHGLEDTECDAAHAETMKIAGGVMARYSGALAELAK
jgi:hypothetical protein